MKAKDKKNKHPPRAKDEALSTTLNSDGHKHFVMTWYLLTRIVSENQTTYTSFYKIFLQIGKYSMMLIGFSDRPMYYFFTTIA